MSNTGIKEGQAHCRLGRAARFVAYLLEREERGFFPLTLSSDAPANMFFIVSVSLKDVKNNNEQEVKKSLWVL